MQRSLLVVLLAVIVAAASAGFHCGTCSGSQLDEEVGLYLTDPFNDWETSKWWGARYSVIADVGNHILARCYDVGGGSSGSFIILFGEYRSVDLGEKCDTFVELTILEGDDLVKIQDKTHCARRGFDAALVSKYKPNLPTKGTILVRVDESVRLLDAHEKVRGQLVATQAPSNNLKDTYRFRNITLEWDKFQIHQVVGNK